MSIVRGLLRRVFSAPQRSVLIAGIARSGTTALFYKLKTAMPPATRCLFEPREFDPSRVSKAQDVLAKVILANTDMESFSSFTKKILLVRDPRDRIVSGCLYRVYNWPEFCSDETKVAEFVAKLRDKEAAPQSVSMLELIALCDRLGKPPRNPEHRTKTSLAAFHRDNPDYFTFRYEDLILGHFDSLSRYLGIQLSAETAQVPEERSRVGRSKESGQWRDWFTPADVEYFRPRFKPLMDCFGYEDDWTLAANPVVAPEHASSYLLRLVAERRARDQGLEERPKTTRSREA
jgi:hypothetical protein